MARNEKFGFISFSFAALTDWLDGWLARKFGQVSEFGKFMDALADKVLTMGMFVSLLAVGCPREMDSLSDSTDSIKGISYHWIAAGSLCQGKNSGS